jgi:hypothetical protein
MRQATAGQLPLCPVSDRGREGTQYVAEGHNRTFGGARELCAAKRTAHHSFKDNSIQAPVAITGDAGDARDPSSNGELVSPERKEAKAPRSKEIHQAGNKQKCHQSPAAADTIGGLPGSHLQRNLIATRSRHARHEVFLAFIVSQHKVPMIGIAGNAAHPTRAACPALA